MDHTQHDMNNMHDHPKDHAQISHKQSEAHNDHDHGNHEAHVDHSGHEQMFRKRFFISTLISIPVLIFSSVIQDFVGYSLNTFPGAQWITPLFAIAVFFYGGVPFIKMAVPEIKNRKPGMMTLISLAIMVSFVYSLAAQFFSLGMTFFWELVTLIDIMLLGHWIEMRSIRQASGALNELAKLIPDEADRIQPDGSVETVALSDLRKGDMVLVRPGSSVPADGKVVQGSSNVNESMITGESQPVHKTKDAQVLGGTINGDGSLHIRITATGDETALAGIMRLVKEAQKSKSNTQILADKAAGWLFYVALSVALITAIAWVIAIGFDVSVIERVATVLVIACPHALGLAIPLVVAITTSMGASNGILIRDRLALEKARKVTTVIFDKTGTLTKGQFGIVDMAFAQGQDEKEALGLAAAIEGDSEHTIARAIRDKAAAQHLNLPKVSGFEAIKGRGARAEYRGAPVYVGGPRLLEMFKLAPAESLQHFSDQTNQKGQSVIHLIQGNHVIASFALADEIREESRLAIEKLHKMGIQVVMLTGDSRQVAQSVAEDLKIDEFFAEVLPQDKDKMVQKLQEQGKLVAMVGDGVNDAPALMRADVGIAIGSGTDVAVESAGLILVKNNPLDVLKIFALSKASYRKMIQNLIWATGYNLFALPLAAGVLAPIGFVLSPAVGALFMSLSTVIVAINAQLLKRQELTDLA